MVTHRLQLPPQILIGRDMVRAAARDLRRTVGKRILMITETGLADSGAAEALRTGFEDEGLSVVLFTGVGSRSVSSACENAIAIGRAGFVEAVVGFGSASTMSLARLTGALLGGDEETSVDADDVLDAQRAELPGLPFVAVPALPFDPFLCSTSALVIDARNRVSRMITLRKAAHMVLFDSAIFESMTRKQGLLAVSGALLLSLEGLFSRGRSPVADPLNRESIEQAIAILRRAASKTDADAGTLPHEEFTDEIAGLSLRASFTAAFGGPGPGTVICAEVHARTGLGLTAAAPAVIGPLLAACMERFPTATQELASVTGEPPEHTETMVRELLSDAGLLLRLREMGIDRDRVSGIPENVGATGVLDANGGAFSEQDVVAVLDSAL